MLNEEVLKLMIADIIESRDVGDSLSRDSLSSYKVYPTDDLDDLVDEIKASGHKILYKKYQLEEEWFVILKRSNHFEIKTLTNDEYTSFLKNNEKEIRDEYKEFESNSDGTYNEVEIREIILSKASNDSDEAQLLEVENIIYQDVSLESIAEVLVDVNVEDLVMNLGYYGTWSVMVVDEVNYLVEN